MFHIEEQNTHSQDMPVDQHDADTRPRLP